MTLYKKHHLIEELRQLLEDDIIDIDNGDMNCVQKIYFETKKDGNDLIVKVFDEEENYPSQVTDGSTLNNTFRIKIEYI